MSLFRPRSMLVLWSSLTVSLVHPVLDAPNVLTVKLPRCGTAMRRAKEHFDVAVRPHLEAGLIEALEEQPLPCRSLRHDTHGNFFVMKGGSSTDPAKSKSSDLAWISVDDLATWQTFREIFEETGVAEAVASLISPLHQRVQLYSSFYVVRSHCTDANWHADWPEGTGTSAWTLLAPLERYETADFQLLYKDCKGAVHQYRYEEGEAILFGSHFMHSTEPGRARRGAAEPHAFLCFTFGRGSRLHSALPLVMRAHPSTPPDPPESLECAYAPPKCSLGHPRAQEGAVQLLSSRR